MASHNSSRIEDAADDALRKKLVDNQDLAMNKKTQVITTKLRGEMIYDSVEQSIKSLLNPA